MDNTHTSTEYYIGIMSGTSMDAIDTVLVQFHSDTHLNILAKYSRPFPAAVRNQLQRIILPNWTGTLKEIADLNVILGDLYADTAQTLIEQSRISKEQIRAIGNHGQTIWHQPIQAPCFSWQLGDANRISERTGVTTVADFRNRDIAAGGEGAPLVPAFHEAVFASPDKRRVIVNIGGISNISVVSPKIPTIGFDTGPGNGLMDAWSLLHNDLPYDENGQWASTGKVLATLLKQLMNDPYFKRQHPKSTGKECFNLDWLRTHLDTNMEAQDIQATLLELTAQTIQQSTLSAATEIDEVFICGGGAKNGALLSRLQSLMNPIVVDKTNVLGIDADWVEAIAFAWLARQTMRGLPGNLPSTTGAKGLRVLGAIYPA